MCVCVCVCACVVSHFCVQYNVYLFQLETINTCSENKHENRIVRCTICHLKLATPRFYLTAMEKNLANLKPCFWATPKFNLTAVFLHSCKIVWPGNEAKLGAQHEFGPQ